MSDCPVTAIPEQERYRQARKRSHIKRSYLTTRHPSPRGGPKTLLPLCTRTVPIKGPKKFSAHCGKKSNCWSTRIIGIFPTRRKEDMTTIQTLNIIYTVFIWMTVVILAKETLALRKRARKHQQDIHDFIGYCQKTYKTRETQAR